MYAQIEGLGKGLKYRTPSPYQIINPDEDEQEPELPTWFRHKRFDQHKDMFELFEWRRSPLRRPKNTAPPSMPAPA